MPTIHRGTQFYLRPARRSRNWQTPAQRCQRIQPYICSLSFSFLRPVLRLRSETLFSNSTVSFSFNLLCPSPVARRMCRKPPDGKVDISICGVARVDFGVLLALRHGYLTAT